MPEELPLKEAAELSADLKKEFGIDASLILNKVLDTKLTVDGLSKLKSTSKALNSFSDYLQFHIGHQNDMKERAKKMAAESSTLPLILDSNPWTLVEKIAEVLP